MLTLAASHCIIAGMIQALSAFFANPHTYAVWLTVLLVLVIAWDLKSYIIPNWINLAIVLSFVPAAYFLHLPALESGIALSFMLALMLVLFALGLLGGGDAKLMAALSLWTGYHMASLTLIVYIAILGGVFTIALWLFRRVIGFFWRRDLPPLFRRGAPVPYGVAIAGGFIIMLWQNRIPSLLL